MGDSTLTAACDPERWLAASRADLLAAAGVVPDDLVRTVRRHRKLLNAQTTKHFAHEGKVTDERTHDDNDAQARAVELFYDVFGVKAPRAQAQTQAMGVEIVIDTATGQVVVRAVSQTTQQAGQGARDVR